jgi:hypothetical protein
MPKRKMSRRPSLRRINQGPSKRGGGRLNQIEKRATLETLPVAGGRRDVIPMQISPKSLTIQQIVNLGSFTTSATPGTEVDMQYYFYLNQLTGVTSLVGAWDQYKFEQVTLNFQPVFSQQSFTSASGGVIGNFATVIDYDDVASTNYATLLAYETCLHTPAYFPHSRTLRPRVASALYSGSTFSGYGNLSSPWIDTASGSVQHYGIKAALTNNNSTVAVSIYYIIGTYTITFRSIR